MYRNQAAAVLEMKFLALARDRSGSKPVLWEAAAGCICTQMCWPLRSAGTQLGPMMPPCTKGLSVRHTGDSGAS